MSAPDRDPDRPSGSGRSGAGEEPAPQAGVLGNLPRKRPSVRSPRRAAARDKATAEEQAEAGPAQPRPTAEPRSEPPPTAAPGRHAGEEPEHSHAADIEALARGGIAIAGDAASLGLRIAGRAAAALRDAVERR